MMKEPATPDATETPITVLELIWFFGLPSLDADEVVIPLGEVEVLSVLVVASSTQELEDVDRKVIVESPVEGKDIVEAGNFEVDECNLVCEVL